MTWLPWAAVLALCLLAWYLTFTASRLDRLHHRVETSRAALEAELARRASAAVELATSGLLDPAAALVVASAAAASLDAPPAPSPLRPRPRRGSGEVVAEPPDEVRWRLETDLSQALAVALVPEVRAAAAGTPAHAERVGRLLTACRRVELARRFHNDAVVQARRLRAKRVVRWCRLAGHARLPRTADFDDGATLTAPPGQERSTGRRPGPPPGS